MLIATLLVSSVLGTASSASFLMDTAHSYFVGMTIIRVLVSVISLYAVFRLIKMRNSSTIKWATVAVWLSWAGVAVVKDVWFFYEVGEIPPKFPIRLAGNLLFSGAWVAYLKFSKRVRNTYLLT